MRILVFFFLLLWPAASPAAVEIAFYSREFGVTFPHGYITLTGTLDATGERIDADYGFTLRHLIGPSVLFGPVEGHVSSGGPDYVALGRRQFSMVLTDAEYHSVMALVERWRALPQPSYRLDQRNCVSFVAEVATLLGLRADPRRWMRRPRAFLEQVRDDNEAIIAARAPTTAAGVASGANN